MFMRFFKRISDFYQKLASWQTILLWLALISVLYFLTPLILVGIGMIPFIRYSQIDAIRAEVKTVPQIKNYELGWNEDITVEDIWIDLETQTGGKISFVQIGSLTTASQLVRVGDLAFIVEYFYRDGERKGQHNGNGWSIDSQFIANYQISPKSELAIEGDYRVYQGLAAIRNYEKLFQAVDSLPKCDQGFVQETQEHWIKRTCVYHILPEQDTHYAQDDDPATSKWRIPSPTNACYMCNFQDSKKIDKIYLETKDGVVWRNQEKSKGLN